MIPEISATSLATEMIGENPPFLVDVREGFEREIACLDDNAHIPMGEFQSRVGSLDRQLPIVVYCRTGARSAAVVEYLIGLGFPNVRNLAGGILSWSTDVDPTVQRY